MKPRDIAGFMRLSAKEVSRKRGVALQKLKQCVLDRLQQHGYTPEDIRDIAHRLEELYRETDSGG